MYSTATAKGPKAPLVALGVIQDFLKAQKIDTISLRKTLVACSELEYAYKLSSSPDYIELTTQHDPQEARQLLSDVLKKYKSSENQSGTITNQTLLEYFSCDHPPSTTSSLSVLSAFAEKSPKNAVPEQIAMIPFRRAIYQADFRGALDVMDHTCGKLSNYKRKVNAKIRKYGTIWAAGLGGTLFGAHSVLMSGLVGTWEFGTSIMICGMFGTYLSALSLFGTMAMANSKSGLGSVLEWVPGTSPLYRFRHSEQLRMATFVTELNRSLPENLGECSPQLLQDLSELNLKPVETDQEAYMKEYWARGGDGFEWTEPDQDPADLLWRDHMEATKQKRIGSAYSRKDSEGKLLSWVSEVEREKEGRSIPHASLMGVDELRGPEGMKSFEQELKEDMMQLKNEHRKQIGGSQSNEEENTSDKDNHKDNDKENK